MVSPAVQLSLSLELILMRDNHNLCLGEGEIQGELESPRATLTIASSIMEDRWAKGLDPISASCCLRHTASNPRTIEQLTLDWRHPFTAK
jgi:hypothetical protein